MTMDPRLQAWLDGELAFDDLPDSQRAQAADWSLLLDDVRDLPAPGAPAGATSRIMEAIRAEAAAAPVESGVPAGPSAWQRLSGALLWLVRPRPVRISPLVAAALLGLVVWSGTRILAPEAEPGTAAKGPAQVYVQFVMAAPEARSVALAGDFNEWDPSIELSDPDLDGVWTARVALEAGVHEYMFVIDGSEWRPDPNALSYTDDGFGQRNSVLAVAPLDQI